uniref:Uncharacterized protein n=1 Tax=uncultured Planctomycetota bacterium TaxID=120965 RepID=H5SCS1_9BACT|nr:hypothetical protein HGMM_F11F07C29 [uncultured Planctomycetota bacterium]
MAETGSIFLRIHDVNRIADLRDQSHAEGDYALVYLGLLRDALGNTLSYSVIGQPLGIDVLYVTDDCDAIGEGAYLGGTIDYSNVESNAPPVEFPVLVVADGDVRQFLWRVTDTNRPAGKIDNFSGNEGDTVFMVLPRPESAASEVSWFVVNGLPDGLVYDYYYGAIMGRIDYTAVTSEEGTKDFSVTVAFYEGSVVDEVSFVFTVRNVDPLPGDMGVGVVVYRTKEFEATVLLDDAGEVLAATATPSSLP